MTIEASATRLKSGLPDIVTEVGRSLSGDPWISIPPASVLSVIRFLRDELGYGFLSNLSGVDDGTALTVVYHFSKPGDAECITLKTVLPRDGAVVESISGLYGNADWFEREAYDLLGIRFQNHPDLRRLMMPDDWEGHPLRKDYSPPAEYHGISCDRPDIHRVLDVLYQKGDGLNSEPETRNSEP
jgi:NADH-quinone oxidoreductase subunit C